MTASGHSRILRDDGPVAITGQEDRRQLALALRLAERFGFHEGICNHFSVRVDGPEERYLVNPYGVHWSLIEPADLLLMDGSGNLLEGVGEVDPTARFIHVAGHRANARHKAIFHTHMPWATTLTLLDGDAGHLRMAHQTACRFFGRVAYESRFGGLALDDAEGERIASAARAAPGIDITFLAHHGVVVGAASTALAFDELYYLERACRQQVLAMQTGAKLKDLPQEIVRRTAEQNHSGLERAAEAHLQALDSVLRAHPDRVMSF